MQIYVLRVFDSQIREGAKSNNFSLSDIGNGEYVYSHFRVHKYTFFCKTKFQFFKPVLTTQMQDLRVSRLFLQLVSFQSECN